MTSSATAPKRGAGSRKGEPPRRVAALDKYHNFKVCGKCGKKKQLADFALATGWQKKRAANPKRYRANCKPCMRAPSAYLTDDNFAADRRRDPARRFLTPKEKKEYAAQYKRRTRRDARIRTLEYLASKGCTECGERDPRVLEFDHIDPGSKSCNVSALLSDGYGWGSERLREEIRKCRVICANCHRKHTITQQGHYSHEDVRTALRQIFADHGVAE